MNSLNLLQTNLNKKTQPSVLDILRKNKPVQRAIVAGMDSSEIAEVVSEHLISIVKKDLQTSGKS